MDNSSTPPDGRKAGPGPRAPGERPLASLKTVTAVFIALLARGLWPVGIYPRGVKRSKGGITEGKEPFGPKWGLVRWTLAKFRELLEIYKGAGCGLCLGPGRGPEDKWLIDAEGDGPEAEESRARLFGGEMIPTLGWGSVRGGHQLFTADGERMGAIVAKLDPFEVKAKNQPGVFHIPTLPGLELRLGGFKADGTVKQLQSVVPPTPGTDGKPRAWNGVETVADVPEAFYAGLEAAVAAAAEARPTAAPAPSSLPTRPTTDRADSWLRKALENAAGKVAMATTEGGGRHATLMAQARTMAGFLHYGKGFTESELASTMVAAADRAAPERRGDHPRCVADAIADGKAAPLTLPDELHAIATGQAPAGATKPIPKASTNGDGRHATIEAGTGGVSAGGVAPFPQVRPIRMDLRPVPPMVADLIPEPYRKWLADIAERASCPLDLPVMSAIVSTGALLGRKVGIRPKRHDDWLVVANLWGMGILPPGWLKTHCLEEPKKPLARLEIEAKGAHALALRGYEVDKMVADSRADAAKAALKDAGRKKLSDDEMRKLASEAMADPGAGPPTPRRYIVNDVTVEKLGELQVQNPTGLLQYRDELMGFLRSMEKQGYENVRSYYLEGWVGTLWSSCDRIGRGSLTGVPNTVGMLGSIQPGRLADWIRSAASGNNDDGLISRFQLMVYPDVGGPFVNVDRWPDTAAKDRAYEVFRALADLDPAALGATIDAADAGKDGAIPYLRFAADAQDFFDGWRADLEELVRSGRESAALTGHLAKYRSLMPSLSLQFHLVNVAGGEAPGPVSLAAARRAAAWCDYLEEHARRVYQMAFDGDPEPAQRLAERIKASLPNPFSVRQVVQKGWSGLGTTEDVERAVAILEAHGWVRTVEVPSGPGGGRPSVEIHVNPLAAGAEGGEA